jgi:hypothetical protein
MLCPPTTCAELRGLPGWIRAHVLTHVARAADSRTGRGRCERSVEHERTGGLHLRVELGPGLEVGLIAARRICVGPHQHQVAHALRVSPRPDIDPGRSTRPELKPPREDFHMRSGCPDQLPHSRQACALSPLEGRSRTVSRHVVPPDPAEYLLSAERVVVCS